MTADASAAVRDASVARGTGSAATSRESAGQSATSRERRADGSPPAPPKSERATYSSRRSPARATALIVGAVVIGVVAVVLVVGALGGSSSKAPTTSAAATTAAHARAHHTPTTTTTSATTTPSEPSTPTVSAAETQVAVLNGTSTAGLAHRLSIGLQQSGYSQATALNGTPPGNHQTTIVEYSSGHRGEAAHVARALGVTQVQPIEATVSPLAGGSTVIVIAGLDKAGATGEATSGSGEASSGGGSAP
jgi:hypothetical protein